MLSAEHNSIRLKTHHLSLEYIFINEIDGGLLSILLGFLCTGDIYNLFVSLFNRDPGIFSKESTALPLDYKSIDYKFYSCANAQIQHFMTGSKLRVFKKMQEAAQNFGEGSILLSGSTVVQAIFNENWSSSANTDSDYYITLDSLPTILKTLHSLGAILTGRFRDYCDFQRGLVPYMTNDILFVLRFVVLSPQEFSSYNNRSRDETVTFDIGESVVHLKTSDSQYVIYIPSRECHGPKIDIVVTKCPSVVIKQFDFQICSNYLDLKNATLVMTYPTSTCLRTTDMNTTDKNTSLLDYFMTLANNSSFLPSHDSVFGQFKGYLPHHKEDFSSGGVLSRIKYKIENTVGGIFADCFDGTEFVDLNCVQGLELFIVSLARAQLLKSTQANFFFSYSPSKTVDSYNCFELHDATVDSFFPRYEKYASSPRNIAFVGKLGFLSRHKGWSSIVRPLCTGFSRELLEWDREHY